MKKKAKAAFLDRDGTINVDKHYLYRIEDFEFLPGVIDGLRSLQEAGYLLIVVTNQSGIGRGYYTEADFHRLNDWMVGELKAHGVDITAVYYCPHLPDAAVEEYRMECECRKPKLGMYYQAAEEWNIDFAQSIAIGDNLRDCEICRVEGCRGFLIGKQHVLNKNIKILKKWKDIMKNNCCDDNVGILNID